MFVGIPLGLFLLIAAGVYGRTAMHRDRYRPGRAWEHAAVWFVPHPAALDAAPGSHAALTVGATPATPTGPAAPEALGGASGEW